MPPDPNSAATNTSGARPDDAGLAIRDAAPSDEGAWRSLWADYLAFYRTELSPKVSDATWARILSPDSRLACRVAVAEGRVQGFAVWHWHEASWSLRPDCYLEDLFVAPAARGLGLGRALIDDLILLARARGYGRLYWHTDDGNSRARALYDSYIPSDGHIRYRLTL